jgi:hypothetical protein
MVKEPSQEELEKAISKLKTNKATGEDDVIAGLIKTANRELKMRLPAPICRMWRDARWLESRIDRPLI